MKIIHVDHFARSQNPLSNAEAVFSAGRFRNAFRPQTWTVGLRCAILLLSALCLLQHGTAQAYYFEVNPPCSLTGTQSGTQSGSQSGTSVCVQQPSSETATASSVRGGAPQSIQRTQPFELWSLQRLMPALSGWLEAHRTEP